MPPDTRKQGPPPRLLLLGGTPQAGRLAAILAARFGPRLEVAAMDPAQAASRAVLREAAVLRTHLSAQRVGIVVDAMHPLTVAIRHVVAAVARDSRMPILMLRPPPWSREPGDRWIEVPDAATACAAVRRLGRRVFLTVDAPDLEQFASLRGVFLLVRVPDPPPSFPIVAGQLVCARGPFRVAEEVEMLRRARIDAIVTRPGGGRSSGAKIAAARRLRLPVVIIQSACEGVALAGSALAASDWVARLLSPAAGDA